MEKVSDPTKALPFDFDNERENFERTFAVLNNTLSDQAFAYANKSRTRLTHGFSVYHFEAITLGVQGRVNSFNPNDTKQMEELKQVLMDVKLDPEFIKLTTGGGKNSPGQLAERTSFVQGKVEALV